MIEPEKPEVIQFTIKTRQDSPEYFARVLDSTIYQGRSWRTLSLKRQYRPPIEDISIEVPLDPETNTPLKFNVLDLCTGTPMAIRLIYQERGVKLILWNRQTGAEYFSASPVNPSGLVVGLAQHGISVSAGL